MPTDPRFPSTRALLEEKKLSAFVEELGSLEGQVSGPAKPKELVKVSTQTPIGQALRELAASNVLSAPVFEGDSGDYAGILDVADVLASLMRSELGLSAALGLAVGARFLVLSALRLHHGRWGAYPAGWPPSIL